MSKIWDSTGIDYRTPVQRNTRLDRGYDSWTVRVIRVALCVAHREASAASKVTFKQFADLLGPGIPESTLKMVFKVLPTGKVQGISTCGLAAEGIDRMSGVICDWLHEPYFPTALGSSKRKSIVRAIHYGREMGAWKWAEAGTEADNLYLFAPGDNVIVGARSAGEDGGGTEHSLICLRWKNHVDFDAFEGGQVCPKTGLQRCAINSYRVISKNDRIWLARVSADDRLVGNGKRLLGWNNCASFRYDNWYMAPDGWRSVKID
jgi:hypothetical protein